MNAHQRRTRRRRLGIRPPFRCLWCQTDLPRWDAPCACPPGLLTSVRRMFADMTLEQLALGAWDRGLDLRFEIVPKTTKATP